MKAKRYRNAPCGPQGAPGAPERAGGYGTLPADETEALRGLQRRGGHWCCPACRVPVVRGEKCGLCGRRAAD
jgi:hypothetical protein